jgi:hypothetical protein
MASPKDARGEPIRRWPRAMADRLSRPETLAWLMVGIAFVAFVLVTLGLGLHAAWGHRQRVAGR